MSRATHFQIQKQPLITIQDVVYVIILIAISLLFSFMPTFGYGQTLPDNILDNAFPPPPSATFASPSLPEQSIPSEAAPAPALTPANSSVANQFQPISVSNELPPQQNVSRQEPVRPEPMKRSVRESTPLQSVMSADHPFAKYWGVPNDPQTKITGKPFTVAELFEGTRSASARCQLLQSYWELSGLFAVYHFRCEMEQLANASNNMEQLTFFREQRRSAEIEFIKQQWVLAELVKQYKGKTLRETDLPIPSDYPLYLHYETFADKIARSERTQYLGRMIPIQEQLIETKNNTWTAASMMTLDQRASAFLELTKTVVEYNKMIAEYALETIPPNVSGYQLVGAVVKLPKRDRVPSPSRPIQQPATAALPPITLTDYTAPQRVVAEPVEQIASEFKVSPAEIVVQESVPPENTLEENSAEKNVLPE